MSAVRAFHLPGSSAVAVLQRRAYAALAAWAADWINDKQRLETLHLECIDGQELHWSGEFESLRGAHGRMWFQRGARERLDFGRAVVSGALMPQSSYADDWIAQLAEHAWAARNRALCAAIVGAVETAMPEIGAWPESLGSRGSGAVSIRCEPLGLYAIADAGIWSQVPPSERKATPLPAVVPLERATRHARLRVEVMLGRVELELPKLMDLCHGDVLRLPASLDEPFVVCCEGKPFARALLGDGDGSKAIQFTAQL
jgi:hypothetical protein